MPVTVDVRPGTEKDWSDRKKAGVHEADRERIELDGRREYFRLRNKWSWCIIAWITCLILFNIALAVAIGLGWFDFTEYEWFITAITVETFLQVVGLGYIAVRYLFSDPK
jgi:hypothetical protein